MNQREPIIKAIDHGRPVQGYLYTLDGWRALSIAAVIFCHDKVHSFGPFSTAVLYQHGNIGVDVFFAISGLLICSRLLDEEQKTGNISLSQFYLRRAFRILPPAMFFLAVLLLLKWLVDLPVSYQEVLSSICFLRNYTFSLTLFGPLHFSPMYTSHFWSLAVEEHFYFFLPAFLLFSPKQYRVPLLILFSLLVVVHRFTSDYDPRAFHTDMRLDALLFPAALAIQIRKPAFRERLLPLLKFWPLLLLAIFATFYFRGSEPLSQTVLAWLLPFAVLGTMLRPETLFGRFLELPVLRYIGRLSYSLYLWQQLFIIGHFGVPCPKLATLQQWPWCIVSLAACALFSYYVIERPLIRVGHHVAARFRPQSEAVRAS